MLGALGIGLVIGRPRQLPEGPRRRAVGATSYRGRAVQEAARELFKTGGRLIRHARYFIVQLVEGQLTQRLFAQIIQRIQRLAWHPT